MKCYAKCYVVGFIILIKSSCAKKPRLEYLFNINSTKKNGANTHAKFPMCSARPESFQIQIIIRTKLENRKFSCYIRSKRNILKKKAFHFS